MNALIITPMLKEQQPLLQGFMDAGFAAEESTLGRLPVIRIPECGITFAIGGTGKAQFALQTQHLLDHIEKPELVICAGASGALSDDLSIADVVLGSATVEHDYNNHFNDRPMPRFDAPEEIVKTLHTCSHALKGFRVHVGIIASGDEDIISPERRDAIRAETGAVAVAWEGAGGARACRFSDVPYLEIRGISDAADHDAPAVFRTNINAAMGNIAALLIGWVRLRV